MAPELGHALLVKPQRGEKQHEYSASRPHALQVQPKQALFIGNDMDSNVFGPQQLGVHTIFFSPRPQRTYREIQPNYIISRFAELPAAVDYFAERKRLQE